MKKIIKYSLLIFIIIVLCSIFTHKHDFNEVVYEATYNQYGYIEHICDCGYAYKDQYVNPLNESNLIELQKEIENKKLKNIYEILSKSISIIKQLGIDNNSTYTEFVNVENILNEKIYIVFSKFKGGL